MNEDCVPVSTVVQSETYIHTKIYRISWKLTDVIYESFQTICVEHCGGASPYPDALPNIPDGNTPVQSGSVNTNVDYSDLPDCLQGLVEDLINIDHSEIGQFIRGLMKMDNFNLNFVTGELGFDTLAVTRMNDSRNDSC